MNGDDRPPRFPPGRSPVRWLGRSELPIFAAEGGRPVLPDLILWAFSLNEGDLLAVSREGSDGFRCRFRSYGEAVWTIADGIGDAWFYIKELLRLPMAAVGPHGALLLPKEAAALALRPRDPLLLRVESWMGEGFTLEPSAGRRISPELSLQAHYLLPVEPGFQVRLPEDVVWALDLHPGDRLACKTSLATADFESLAQEEDLQGRSLAELGPGGALTLPDSLLETPGVLRPNPRVNLTVTLGQRVVFRIDGLVTDLPSEED
jgi:hypothetical protein